MAKYTVIRTNGDSVNAYGPFSSLKDAKTFVDLAVEKDIKFFETAHTKFMHNLNVYKSFNSGTQFEFDLDYVGHQTVRYDILKMTMPNLSDMELGL